MSSLEKDDPALYGVPRSRNLANGKEISSSTTLSFTSHLSSLINTQPSSERPSKRSRPGRSTKDDIFTTHNRNTHKRAKLDLEPDDRPALAQQNHSTHFAAVDRSVLERSRRKMQEKSRLYAAMKRGDVADDAGKYGVDFDRKWAEAQAREGNEREEEEEDDDDDDSDSDTARNMVEYTDEFGRTRIGTARDAARAKHTLAALSRGDDGLAAPRPAAPTNLIYGDAIQVHAFQPDDRIQAAMDALAKKRDRSLTPPPDTHFDADREIRTKGTGFYGFSAEAEARTREMEGLERERAETERKREERKAMLEERKKAVEARRRGIVEKRGRKKADEFLDELESEMVEKGIGTDMMSRIHAAVEREEEESEGLL